MSEIDSIRIVVSDSFQTIRLPEKFHFDCKEIAVRRVGQDLMLSPRFYTTEDYWENGARPDDDYENAVLKHKDKDKESGFEQRVGFN